MRTPLFSPSESKGRRINFDFGAKRAIGDWYRKGVRPVEGSASKAIEMDPGDALAFMNRPVSFPSAGEEPRFPEPYETGTTRATGSCVMRQRIKGVEI